MPAGKMCQVCEAEPGGTTCQKCGRLMGIKCSIGYFCKDCASGQK